MSVVAIVGASGAVGRELIQLLEDRSYPCSELRLFATPRSAGKMILFRGQELTIERTDPRRFEGCDLVFLAAGASTSEQLAPAAVEAGATVIDNSSRFRLDPRVPLCVPEVNPEVLDRQHGIIANPNCSTAIAVVALAPLHRRFGIQRLFAATYQAASGAGAEALEELRRDTRAALDGGETGGGGLCPAPRFSTSFPSSERTRPAARPTKRRSCGTRPGRFLGPRISRWPAPACGFPSSEPTR